MNKLSQRTLAGLVAVGTVLALSACGGSSRPDTPSNGPEAPEGAASADGIFLNAMPPGSVGNSAGGVGAPLGDDTVLAYPDHFADQLELYGNLAYSRENLRAEPCNPPANLAEHEPSSDLACNYYKHMGLEPETVTEQTTLQTPKGEAVTIRRDGWGVPFITAPSRGAAMFGIGYASSQDRMWLHDLLRAIGRGRLSEFLGAAPDTLAFDADIAVVAGYDEAELDAMIEGMRRKYGPLGDLIVADIDAMVNGINAYIESVASGPNVGELPPEYLSLALQVGGPPRFPPEPWTRRDIVASATLIQSLFGTGGGEEHLNVELLQALDSGFGPGASQVPQVACEFWRDLRHARDPETAYTITEREWRTQSPPDVDERCPQALPAGAAIFDPGSLQTRSTFVAGGAAPGEVLEAIGGNLLEALPGDFFEMAAAQQPLMPATATARAARVEARPPLRAAENQPPARTFLRASPSPREGAREALGRAGLPLPRVASNFISVPGSETRDGFPITVQGPQTAYFVPQLLWEVAVVSGGDDPGPLDFAGRGVIFGNLPYINIGRGLDFAWSATTGGSDIADVRVSRLCNMDGTPASRQEDADGFLPADGYLVDVGDGQGMQCRRLYRRLDEWTALPTGASLALGGPPEPQGVERRILRTHYGPVFATATVNGEPVALSLQRATFFGELETAAGFALATTRKVTDFRRFTEIFNTVTGTFNWAYIDADDVGVFHGGLYPQRDGAHPPELPSWGNGRFDWPGQQATLTAAFFESFGGDGNAGALGFPNTAAPQAVGDPMDGYFEWDGYLARADKPQVVNPDKGFIQAWNNAPAVGWWAADARGNYGPADRAQMLESRMRAFRDSGRKHDIASMIEIASDVAHVDTRGETILPWIIDLVERGPMTAEQQQVLALMREWLDAGSMQWISGQPGLGAYRRDRDDSGTYDQRAQVVLADAWFEELIPRMLPQLENFDGPVLNARTDLPRAQGGAFNAGWFQHMKRVADMALDTPGHTPYRQLRCADSDAFEDCRDAVLAGLDAALETLGGLDNIDNWDGSQLEYPKGGCEVVEDCDAVVHVPFSFLPVPTIHWTNRPTYQQAVQIRNRVSR